MGPMFDKQSSDELTEVDHFWVTMPTPDQTQGNAVFASMQYFMEAGPGGYFGTQVWRKWVDPRSWRNGSRNLLGTRIGASETHKMLFSMWDKDASHRVTWEGPNCERFGGEYIHVYAYDRFSFVGLRQGETV